MEFLGPACGEGDLVSPSIQSHRGTDAATTFLNARNKNLRSTNEI